MISRRSATIGGLIALLWPGRILAAGPLVPFQLKVFIPSPGVRYLGDVFGGGDKAIVEGTIDLGQSGPSSLSVRTRYLGPTKRYPPAAAQPVAGKPDWYVALAGSATPTETGQSPLSDEALSARWQQPAGGTHGVRITVDAANPLVTGAPAIDASFHVGLRLSGSRVEYLLSAEHDGFPSYRLTLGAGALVYDYDCVAAGDTPTALFPPMDRSVTASAWQGLAV